jgi:Glycosyl transferase family 41
MTHPCACHLVLQVRRIHQCQKVERMRDARLVFDASSDLFHEGVKVTPVADPQVRFEARARKKLEIRCQVGNDPVIGCGEAEALEHAMQTTAMEVSIGVIGVDCDCPVEAGEGLVHFLELQQEGAAVAVCSRIVRIDGNGLLVAGQCRFPLVERPQRVSAQQVHSRLVRLQRDGLVTAREGLTMPAESQQRECLVGMGFEMIGLDPDDLVIAGDCISRPSALLQHDATPVDGLHKPRIDRDGPVVARQRFVDPPEILAGLRAAVMGDLAVRIECYRSVETRQCGVRLTELSEREAAIAMSSRIARLDLDHSLKIQDRLLQIFRLAREDAHGIERIIMIGLGVEYFLVDQASGCQLSLLLQGLCLGKLLREAGPAGIRHHFEESSESEVAGEHKVSLALRGVLRFKYCTSALISLFMLSKLRDLLKPKKPPSQVHSTPASTTSDSTTFSRPRSDRIQIGYFSADFRAHPVAQLAAGLFERHDRTKFEVTAFVFGPEASDAMVSRLTKAFDRFIDVRYKSDLEVAALARELGIDIAVDPNGFTQHCRTRIFALRAAPIQINFLGYPGTMGAGFMDYLIADGMVVPREQQGHYAEKIAYLPGSFLPFDSSCAIADRTFAREELGLPSRGFVFCCFNNSYKILPEVFDRWMRILGRTENSVLWLQQANAAAAGNLRREASRRGIDGGRLIFADRMASADEHLARLRAADLFLDTFPYNAHATALDALWAGVPLLTYPGKSFASRVAASLVRTVGLPELIAGSPSQYEEIAVELAADPARLGQLRRKLAMRDTSLFDTEHYTRKLEAAYETIYERHHSGSPPAHINGHLAT